MIRKMFSVKKATEFKWATANKPFFRLRNIKSSAISRKRIIIELLIKCDQPFQNSSNFSPVEVADCL